MGPIIPDVSSADGREAALARQAVQVSARRGTRQRAVVGVVATLLAITSATVVVNRFVLRAECGRSTSVSRGVRPPNSSTSAPPAR